MNSYNNYILLRKNKDGLLNKIRREERRRAGRWRAARIMVENYSTYYFSVKEKVIYFFQGFIIAAILGMLFYQSYIAVLIFSPISFLFIRKKRKQRIIEQQWKLNLEFKDGIISLLAALNAGYSIEHAFEEAREDLKLIYDEKTLIMKEFNYLINQINMNITVERALCDFGERTGIEDIISFAEVFTTAKRTGGDIIKVIQTTCNTIGDKIEIKREIKTLITAKKFDADIMKVIPFGIILYLLVSSPGFLDPLYHNTLGVILMTVLLGFYLGASILAEKIMKIEV